MPRKRRTFSIDFKKEVVAQYLGGETLHRVARRHHIDPGLLQAIRGVQAGESRADHDDALRAVVGRRRLIVVAARGQREAPRGERAELQERAPLDPATTSEAALWAEFDRLTPIFLARRQAIRAGATLPPAAEGASLLELCRELAYRMLAHCNFCPWDCRVDRVAGARLGACKLASGSRVSSHFHHTGEELFYRGTQGSGTIFFTSCNMRCAFCQNGDSVTRSMRLPNASNGISSGSKPCACSCSG